jgi:uncharacterized membrane-anchored protein
MAIAALITWLITAGFGFYMLSTWISAGGTRSGADGAASHFAPPRVFAHFLLALAGLLVWIIYLIVDKSLWAWIAFVDLIIVAVIGDLLVLRWSTDRRLQKASAGGTSPGSELAEQRIPFPVVVLHGVFAVSTVVLVLLSALEIGPS